MLRKAVDTANITFMELSRRLKLDKSILSRSISCAVYRNKAFYDELYAILEGYGGDVPKCEEVVAYPSGRELGTWDIYIDEEFFITWRFYDYQDVLNFVFKKDERLSVLEKYHAKDTVFRNNVRLR